MQGWWYALKSGYRITNRAQEEKRLREIVLEEVYKERDHVYATIQDDILRQVFAVCCMALHHHFGFGSGRLMQFKQAFEAEVRLMEGGIFGRTYTTRDCEKWLSEKMGITLDEKEAQAE